ncbi:MAG: hypothetical protein HKL90_00490 [Elusimicrobia bacterium]|nr:hypothetical protein [Elusimicrobiota bacterium]
MITTRTKYFVRYKNLSGSSTVLKYEIKKDGLTIRFADHTVYRYTNQSAGPENIRKMKTLANAGKGLGTFITANLKDRFLRKIR